jgi:hypothetical protein
VRFAAADVHTRMLERMRVDKLAAASVGRSVRCDASVQGRGLVDYPGGQISIADSGMRRIARDDRGSLRPVGPRPVRLIERGDEGLEAVEQRGTLSRREALQGAGEPAGIEHRVGLDAPPPLTRQLDPKPSLIGWIAPAPDEAPPLKVLHGDGCAALWQPEMGREVDQRDPVHRGNVLEQGGLVLAQVCIVGPAQGEENSPVCPLKSFLLRTVHIRNIVA